MRNIVLSLFDFTGNWSKPYKDNGFNVIQVEIKHGIDIMTWDYTTIDKNSVYGILAAVPCTDYAVSGAKHFAQKDIDGRTEKSQLLVAKVKEIIDYFNPTFWVVENPISRIHRLNLWLGNSKMYFHPYDYAYLADDVVNERYSKKTALYGKFNLPVKNPLPCLDMDRISKPIAYNSNGKRLGFHTEECKALRQITPQGFSRAFYKVNNDR